LPWWAHRGLRNARRARFTSERNCRSASDRVGLTSTPHARNAQAVVASDRLRPRWAASPPASRRPARGRRS
jgi:hypothetical protein